MEVILLQSVPPVGARGEIVRVKAGYARNYLFPRKLAIPATEANQRVFREEEQNRQRRDTKDMEVAKGLSGKLDGVSCTITAQVGEDDKLYGSVTAADIAKELANQSFDIDRKKILLDEPIKKVGVYSVDVKLHREVIVPIKVWVVKQ